MLAPVDAIWAARSASPPGRSLMTAVNRPSRPSATRPLSITRLSTLGSMLPPQSKRTTRLPASSFSFPDMHAARGVAAAPSTVVLHGRDFGEAKAHAHEIANEKELAYIDGYDDPAIIAGQGTMGVEIVEQVPDLDAMIVPVGGAGLIAGVSLAVKALRPNAKIVAVEAENVASFSAALEAGKPTQITMHPTLADGLAIPQVGANAFKIARPLIDQTLTVAEEQIAVAILRLVELEKSVVEGAAATPLAACMSGKLKELAGKRVVLLLCGGNIDPNVLSRVIESEI